MNLNIITDEDSNILRHDVMSKEIIETYGLDHNDINELKIVKGGYSYDIIRKSDKIAKEKFLRKFNDFRLKKSVSNPELKLKK